VIHRLELYPCFIHLYRRRSRKRNHDDRGLLRRETAARGTVDRTKIEENETIVSGGRKTSDGSLNLRNASDVAVHAWVHASTAGTLISTMYAQSRQVPRHFYKYSRTILQRNEYDSQLPVFTPRAGRPRQTPPATSGSSHQ